MTPRPGAPVLVAATATAASGVVVVRTTPGAPDVRVRIRDRPHGWQWCCDTCGPHQEPTCPHERAAYQLTRPAPAGAHR